MKSYPIWVDVTSCLYNSKKSYGAKDTNTECVFVGTSHKNSYHLVKREVTRRSFETFEDYKDVTVFRSYIDGDCTHQLVMCNKTKQMLQHKKARIMEI